MATILELIQDIVNDIGVERPGAVMVATTRTQQELKWNAQKAVKRIVNAHDWQSMMAINTETGDGSTTAFNLPSNYNSMAKGGNVWSSASSRPMEAVDSETWLGYEVRTIGLVLPSYTIYGDQIHIKPAMGSGETAQYFYKRCDVILDNDQTTRKDTWEADNDEFLLDDELLRYSMIWTWKETKGRAYQEDMLNYTERMNQLITDDKGPKTIRVGRKRIRGTTTNAYPYVIGS